MNNSWLAQVAFYLMLGISLIRFAVFLSENEQYAEHLYQTFVLKDELVEEVEE